MKLQYIFFSFITFTLFTNTIFAQGDEVYKIVDEMPIFGSCDSFPTNKEKKSCSDRATMTFMAENISYPAEARQKMLEGMVVLKFIINEKGEITEPSIVKDIGSGCGEEALRVLKTMGAWKPGKKNGKAVKVQMHLPVKFRVVPIIIKSEKYEVLSDLFCESYLTEFIKKDVIRGMAEDELDARNICGIQDVDNYIKSLTLTVNKNGKTKKLVSEDGTFVQGMRDILKNVNEGDVVEFDYIVGMKRKIDAEEGFSKEMYKSVIVE